MAQYADDQWRAMLSVLAFRDAPVELSRRDAKSDGPPIVYRSRLFEVQPDGSMIVERPSQVVLDKAFSKGDDVELLIMNSGERLVATCTILDTHIRQINPTVRVTCHRLSPGRRPQREQRRAFYRVNVAALPIDPVALEYKTEDDDDHLLFPATLVNLSGGGLGVIVRGNRQLLSRIKRVHALHCTARFETGETIHTPVRVAHIEARDEDLLYLGLQIVIDDDPRTHAVEDQLVHLCAMFQRSQLQRRRA